MSSLAIINGVIWDGLNAPFRGTVLCTDTITEVTPGPTASLPPHCEVIDAQGGSVIPAFTDVHMHFSGVVRHSAAVDLSVARSLSDAVSLLLARSAISPADGWVSS
jgi:predicted amidohydrolase YtcJ